MKYAKEQVLQWHTEYLDHSNSVTSLAKKFKVKSSTMVYYFNHHGLYVRHKGFRPNNCRGKDGADNESLRRLWFYNFAYKPRAQRKNLKFTISENDFLRLVTGNCFYCGKCYLEETRLCNGKRICMLTIDRMDPDKGYELENCVPACKQCNTIKMDYTITEFLNKINEIYSWTKSLK